MFNLNLRKLVKLIPGLKPVEEQKQNRPKTLPSSAATALLRRRLLIVKVLHCCTSPACIHEYMVVMVVMVAESVGQ